MEMMDIGLESMIDDRRYCQSETRHIWMLRIDTVATTVSTKYKATPTSTSIACQTEPSQPEVSSFSKISTGEEVVKAFKQKLKTRPRFQ